MPGILVTFASDQHTRGPRLPEGNQIKKLYNCLFQLLLKHAGLDAPGLSRWVYIIPSVFLVLIHDISMSLIPVLVRDLEATGLPTTHTLNGEQFQTQTYLRWRESHRYHSWVIWCTFLFRNR